MTYRPPITLPLVVLLGTIVTGYSAFPVHPQLEIVEVEASSPVELQSPGYPTCCDDKYIVYKVSCVPYNTCFLRMVFTDVDMTAGSSIKIFDEDTFVESISQVGPVHKDSWYRPVVASNTGELRLEVRLVASAETKQHMGFRVNITRATVPGLQNWPDRPITTECPVAPPVQHGSVWMRRFSQEERIHDCVWVIRGPHHCSVYVAISNTTDTSKYDIQIGRDPLAAGPTSNLVFAPGGRLYVQIRKPVRSGDFTMYYGCYSLHYDKSTVPQECSDSSISVHGGFECPAGPCVPGPARCNGVHECSDAADEMACPIGYKPTTLPYTTPYQYPSRPPVFETTVQPSIRSRNPRYMYAVVILPVVLLLLVGGGCYFCIRRKARLRGSSLGPPNEGDPPPIYYLSTQHVKPEPGLLATLPSYEEVCKSGDPPPPYSRPRQQDTYC